MHFDSTSDHVQAWLKGWKIMTDRFLRDFSAAWLGTGDAKPSQELHTETVALQRKEAKAAGTASYAGFVFSRDENGMLTIWQTGTRYITINASEFDGWLAALNSLAPAPDPAVIDLNTDTPMFPGAGGGGMMSAPNTPLTNAQMSQRQNELVARQLKKRR